MIHNESALKTATILCLLMAFFATGCVKNNVTPEQPPVNPVNPGDYFNFTTTRNCPVNIDLGLTGYSVLLEIYPENPYTEADGVVTRKNIEPLYRGITDAGGRLQGAVSLPACTKEVYIASPYIGIPLLKGEITAAGIEVDANVSARTFTKAAETRNGPHSVPADMKTLGNWNDNGFPDYILPANFKFPENELYYITKATTAQAIEAYLKNVDGNAVPGIEIVKNTKVNLVFVGKKSLSANNTVIYYTYPTGRKPSSVTEIQKVIAFPASTGISCGSTVQLKYWNKESGLFEEEFPAGVTIGWQVSSNALKSDGNIGNSVNNYYSVSSLNTTDKDKSHYISFFDAASNAVITGIEDRPLKHTPNDNYTDVVLYVQGETPGSIDGKAIPELPKPENPAPGENENTYYSKGVLLFEDTWPYEGDYDMNDGIIGYVSKIYKNTQNQIIAIEDVITPLWDGASFTNGFGYQLPVNANEIASVNISGDYPFPSNSIFKFDSMGLEEAQTKATVIVTDNIKNSLNCTFTIRITFNRAFPEGSFLLPPYNPFLIINSHKERGREVHLPGHPDVAASGYKPTGLADMKLPGTGHDISDAGLGIYYIAKENMPFAIHLPGITVEALGEFCNAANERKRITELFPRFKTWVSSNGQNDKDWYLKK